MRVIYVPLPLDVFDALSRLAARELRHPRHQATRLIVDGLRREAEAAKGGAPDLGAIRNAGGRAGRRARSGVR